jgi:hypothetical protein
MKGRHTSLASMQAGRQYRKERQPVVRQQGKEAGRQALKNRQGRQARENRKITLAR